MKPFTPLIYLKVLWWRYLRFYNRQPFIIWYAIGIFMGWLVCSEYQIWLQTGVWTTFPWE